jgi:hypothetical protein
MGQNRPSVHSFHNAWPRLICPTDDDADGLRFLYPECDELLPCEDLGGREKVNPDLNQTGCQRFVPTVKGYSAIDYYSGVREFNSSHPNHTWAPLELGRALPSPVCVSEFKTSVGKVGVYRLLLLFYHGLLPPMIFLVVMKIVCRFCLMMPWMTQTRKRNEKLQRTARKRKAEVRRMTEGGQEFAVKRAARATGQSEAATEVMQKISDINASKRLSSANAPAPAPAEAEPAPAPAPARPGSGLLALRSNRVAPLPSLELTPGGATSSTRAGAAGTGGGEPSFAEQLRQISAQSAGGTDV